MTLSEYQEQAKRTLGSATMDNLIMGVIGETGEIIDYLKKVFYHGHELDPAQLELELGDLAWYTVSIATANNISLLGSNDIVTNSFFVPPADLNEWHPWLFDTMVALVNETRGGRDAQIYTAVLGMLTRIAEGAKLIGSTFGWVLDLNKRKLLDRYPNGFEKQRSINRY